MVWMLRFMLLVLILFLVYLFIKTTVTSNRKFRQAVKQECFYMVDDIKNVRRNFHLTFKGAVFEGEKYLGTGKNSFEVVSISLWIRDPNQLKRLLLQDFCFIEQKILKTYPKAKIHWKTPFNELMR